MTLALGTVPAGTTLYIPFTSYAGATGASVTLTGLAVTDIEIYKNGSVTQRSSDAGYALLDTDGIDFDGITGLHGFSIDLSDNTDSGFFAVGSWYWVVVSAVTIDSQTVNFIAAVFRIGPAESVAGYPKADVSHFGGTAGTFSSGRPEVNTTHVAGTSQTAGDIIGDTNDIQSRLPAALVGGRIDANAGAISGDATAADNLEAALDGTGGVTITAALTGNITGNLSGSVGSVTGAVGSVTGAVGSVTGNVGGNVTGSVGSVATGGIAAASFAAGAIDAAAIANGAIDRATFAADTGLQSVRSNTAQAGAATTITLDASASATDDIYNNHLIYVTGGTGAGQARYITDYNGTTKVATVATWATNPDNTSTFAILPGDAIPGASAPTAAQVADAVWDEALAGHLSAGSTGEALNAAGAAGDPWITTLPGSYTAGQAGHTVGTYLTGNAYTRLGAPAGASVSADIAAVKAETAAIVADTNELQTDWANGGRLDLIVDSILLDTAEIGAAGAGLTALASAANLATVDTVADAIKAKTDSLTFTVAGVVDANVQRINDVTITGNGQSGTEFGV